ncbi:hypothetical protein PFICI_04328 [Pestalotiopsis fici W106-1]|uniref:AB hydrolase-1 domain-containing protein n=1 Tax=Pestalotiopsis fici (strain W106-1 / CGMCC3.15140) TaxID=1229662 RepID=W3XAK8_PESFW|nr:uncharacterized protein PFICI_04328 [Pestalotiopsis fici W106-1]ETS82452.1 hypothetical protein PFICI_04328 [Pestalotiopsis fici W106-1]
MGDMTSELDEIRHESLSIQVEEVSINVALARRDGPLEPIVFLHGFGGSKEDYLDIALSKSFRGRAFIAFDAPGCGQTTLADYSKLSIPFLVKTAQTVLKQLGIQRFHIVGHSMGGLTALELATLMPESVLSFVNIKGNLGPEDCFLSRQIFTWADEDPEKFLSAFITRNYHSPLFSASLYASNVRSKVRAEAVRGIFESMVHLSDEGRLLEKFLALPFPCMYMFGEQYNTLSYLPTLEKGGVQLAEIPHCGHFPMYSNPVAMWTFISEITSAKVA